MWPSCQGGPEARGGEVEPRAPEVEAARLADPAEAVADPLKVLEPRCLAQSLAHSPAVLALVSSARVELRVSM
jgi:hypothetical protein